MFRISLMLLITFFIMIFWQCENPKKDKAVMMTKKLARFAETEIEYDHNLLTDRQKMVIEKLYRAALIMDDIFLDQVYSKNDMMLEKLQRSPLPEDKLVLNYFRIMFGPFDRLDDNRPFYGGDTLRKPAGANFYPEDMTREEFEKWIVDHPEDEKAFKSEFTVIRRDVDTLKAVPYADYYARELIDAANLLIDAAVYADNPSLRKYLLSRAASFVTNEYFESDMDWMDLKDHMIELVIGPYEVYEDALFNYKAAFECFITIKDPQESEKLAVFAEYLKEMEKNLLIADEHKNFERGSESPIMVVNEVFSAGDTKAGVQTLAFNLPNDERVREAKGCKKVLLKNIHQAKYDKILLPISQKVLAEDQQNLVSFEAFFNHTLMHEISHGLGPGKITINGKETEVRTELKETYSIIEECKADVLGMYNNMFMVEKGVYPKEMEQEMWTTFLSGIFRSIRFGIKEAHGAGNAIIYNYFLEKGAYQFDESREKVSVNQNIIYNVAKELAGKILLIQALGDYNEAKALIETYGVESPSIAKIRANLEGIPVDIKPVFQIEKEMVQ
ncbi:MAG: peptidase [Calditrichaceae bacterium]|nr:peptidase [Calditrichaceae bacterium]RQV93187.1 MAG: peptidase [Calditrichota bacterium]